MNAPTTAATGTEVFVAIHHVMEDLSKAGVGKTKTNTQQNFQYRGVDDVMDALAPSLARHGLLIIPHVNDHKVTERESRSGGKLFHTLLKIDYDFIAVKDGSTKVVGPIYGEAMDSGDKATNKAMAIAYKYACVQAFCIPVTGDDPDAQTHEVVHRPDDAQVPMQGTRQDARKEASPPGKPLSTAPAHHPRDFERTREGKPAMLRPEGIFGYGKKYYDTPWDVMRVSDLEWFLSADRTPQHVRERIVAELAWREYETEKLDEQIARQRAADEANPLSDDIP